MYATYDSYVHMYIKGTSLNECFPCYRYTCTPFHLSFLPQKKQALFSLQHFERFFFFVREKANFKGDEQKNIKSHRSVFYLLWQKNCEGKKSQRLWYSCIQHLLLHGKTLFFLQVTYYSYETVNQKILKNLFPLTQIFSESQGAVQ